MTTFIILLTVLLVAAVVAALRMLRHDHPSAPPRSHLDWASGGPPSVPYALRH